MYQILLVQQPWVVLTGHLERALNPVSQVVQAVLEVLVVPVDRVVHWVPEVLSVLEVPKDLAVREVLLEARETLLDNLAVKAGLVVHWVLEDLVDQAVPEDLLVLAVQVGRMVPEAQAVREDLWEETCQ